jgi:hypothetical protein
MGIPLTLDNAPPIHEPLGGGPPVTHFRALMKPQSDDEDVASGLELETRTWNDGSQGNILVCNFVDLEVIETLAPYEFPTLTLRVPVADQNRSSGGTAWEALSISVRRLFGVTQGSMLNLAGKRQEWQRTLHKTRRRTDLLDDQGRQIWEDRDVYMWEVVAVDGVTPQVLAQSEPAPVAGGANSGVAVEEEEAESQEDTFDERIYCANFLDGKTRQQFNEQLLEDQISKSNPLVMTMNLNNQLVSELVKRGLVERLSSGVYKSLVSKA